MVPDSVVGDLSNTEVAKATPTTTQKKTGKLKSLAMAAMTAVGAGGLLGL